MTGTVKSIFKTLVKVPVTIIVAYFIINLVLFSYFYFRFAGVSYVIMQTAMENNYIPETEDKIIKQAISQGRERSRVSEFGDTGERRR